MVSSMLLGPEGSTVSVCFLRGGSAGEEVSVDLVRSQVKNLVSTPTVKGGDGRTPLKMSQSCRSLLSPSMGDGPSPPPKTNTDVDIDMVHASST